MPPSPLTPLTYAQVREVLSSSAASRFFEAWAEASHLRSEREERLEDLAAQSAVAAARVRLAEELAQRAGDRADEESRRGADPGLHPSVRPFVQLESSALASVHRARAEAARGEAEERQNRAAALAQEAVRIEADLQELAQRRESLRSAAADLAGHVGESCLFFADAEVDGGAWVIPLDHLPLAERELTAFVLHRLAPNAPLAEATPVRDAPAADVPDLPEATPPSASDDPLSPPSEHDAPGSGQGGAATRERG